MDDTMEISLTTYLKWKLGDFLSNMDKRNEARYDKVMAKSFDEKLSEEVQMKLANKAERIRTRGSDNSNMFIEASGYALGMTQDMTGYTKEAWYKYYYGTKLYSIIIMDWLSRPCFRS
jgi:hypothetical protein